MNWRKEERWRRFCERHKSFDNRYDGYIHILVYTFEVMHGEAVGCRSSFQINSVAG